MGGMALEPYVEISRKALQAFPTIEFSIWSKNYGPGMSTRLPKVIKTVIAHGGRNDNIHVLSGSVF